MTKTKKYQVEIDEQVVEALEQGRVKEGRLKGEKKGSRLLITFVAYNRKPRRQVVDETLYRSPNGWLKLSQERTKMWISTSRDIGWNRGATALLNEAQEITRWMNQRAVEEGEYAGA